MAEYGVSRWRTAAQLVRKWQMAEERMRRGLRTDQRIRRWQMADGRWQSRRQIKKVTGVMTQADEVTHASREETFTTPPPQFGRGRTGTTAARVDDHEVRLRKLPGSQLRGGL